MGWANCGTDSQGRPIGYAFAAICDHPGCGAKIDRGLSYVCGDMHGENEISCERYFCGRHRQNIVDWDGRPWPICDDCKTSLLKMGEWREDAEGIIGLSTDLPEAGDDD